MQRLGRAPEAGPRDERGVIAPLTALLMVALMGMAAFAVDTAMMYSEHAQLQNGADSSALAIAQACAKDPASAGCTSANAAATALAAGNALDGVSNVPVSSVNFGAGTVDVTTQARDTSGNNHFSLVFARALGIDTADIRASAQATFGGYSAADVLPLAFSKCESDPGFTKGLQFFPEHGNAIAAKSGYKCVTSSSSGAEVPGGFGWLDGSGCNVRVNLTNPWVGTDTGHDYNEGCATMLNNWAAILSDPTKRVEILVPIFDNVRGTGANAEFHIEAFAQISIRGWHFGGTTTLPKTFMTADATVLHDSLAADPAIRLKNSDTGVYGKFIKKVTLAEAAVMGGPSTYGSLGVQLSK